MSGPLKQVESILEQGAKASTYKFALLRAVTDWIIEHPTDIEESHEIPLSWIASKFIDYYWPLLVNDHPVRQMPVQGTRRIGLAALFDEFQTRIKSPLPDDDTAPVTPRHAGHPTFWLTLREQLLRENRTLRPVQRLLVQVRRQILNQPIRFIQNVPGGRLEVFGLTDQRGGDFEAIRRRAMTQAAAEPILEAPSLLDSFQSDRARLTIPRSLFLELRPLRFCIRASILSKWASYCERIDAQALQGGSVLVRLEDLYPERDPLVLNRYRALYSKLRINGSCILTDRPLHRRWDIDHVVPHSRLPIETFWNLVPTHPAVNREKSNHLIRVTGKLRRRLSRHVDACLSSEDPLVLVDLRRTFTRDWKHRGTHDVVDHLEDLLAELEENTGLPLWTPT